MLGSILIQPQVLARMVGRTPGDELLDEIVSIGQLLAMNPALVDAVAPAFQTASQAFGTTMMTRIQARLPQAMNELREMVGPLVAGFSGLAGSTPPESVSELLERIANGLDGLAALSNTLSDAQIHAIVRRLSTIATGTLGLSQAGFRDDFIAMLTAARTALRTGNAALSNEAAALREALACLLARMETDFYPRFPTLDLDPGRLAEIIIRALRETRAPTVLAQTGCLLDHIKEILLALAEITRAVAAIPRGAAPRSRAPASRAAARRPRTSARSGHAAPPRDVDGQYCWYASWLYATRHQGFDNGAGTGLVQNILPGYPGDEIWMSTDRKQLIYRRAGADDQVLHSSDTPFQWYEAPQFAGPPSAEHFSFGAIPPGFMEDWAFATSVLAKGAAGMWHAVAMGMSPKEYACNIPLWIWNWTDMAGRGAGGAPLPSLISKSLGWGVGSTFLFSGMIPALSVFIGSFEGVHTKTTAGLGFLQWLTLIGGDLLSAVTINAVTGGVRDFSLSLFTLINQTGDGAPPSSGTDLRPHNWDMAGPIISLVNLLIGMAFKASIPRDDYGLPFDNDGGPAFGALYFPWTLLGAPLINAFGNFFGTLLAWAIGRTATPIQLAERVGFGALTGTLTFIIEVYSQREGSTDDGRYNPRIDPNGTAYSPARSDFLGYPDKTTSPYLLPYAAGTAMYVGQANLGFFSHARYNTLPQVYAYDFAHDFGDEIQAVRGGTVVDFFDWLPDNINPSGAQQNAALAASNTVMGAGWRSNRESWNFITIRHDVAVAGHDRDQGGTPVTTYATYGHGATGGIRTLWQTLYGKAPNQIIGSRVAAGNPIMNAGSVGVSFHNHLHLHVQGGPAAPAIPAGPPVTTANQLVTPGALTDYTLPFVFSDAPGDGVLKNLTWYRSANARTTALPP